MRVYTIALLLLATTARALPPVALLESDTVEVVAGQEVRFSAARSFDPDDDELAFRWNFDDGSSAVEGAEVTHVFDEAGAYRVRVWVSDGSTEVEAALTSYVLNPVGEPSYPSNVICEHDDALFVVAPALGDIVRVQDDSSTRVDLPATAHACASHGDDLWIATNAGVVHIRDSVVVEDWPLEGAREVAADGERVAAYAPATGTLWVLHGLAARTRGVLRGGRGLVLFEGRAWIVRFLSRSPARDGRVDSIALGDGEDRRVELAYDESADTASSGGGAPNLLGALGLSPDNRTLWVGGTKSNSERGLTRDGRELTPENRVRAVLMPIDAGTFTERTPRLDANDAGNVSAVAFSPNGRYAYLAHEGIGAVSVYDLAQLRDLGTDPGATFAFTARVEVGPTPDALLRSGESLYVRLRESLELVELSVADPSNPLEQSRHALGSDPRSPDVALGARLFHDSREPVQSRGGYIACASCHPNGSHDGRTWDFTQFGEGLRNTIDLRGRAGLEHGALHWSGNFDEVQDFENDIVFGFGGGGLAMDGLPPHPPLSSMRNAGRSEMLDALAAYVASLDRVPVSPHAVDERVRRGRDIFFDSDTECAGCHAPPRFTDSQIPPDLHDVGTLGPMSGGRLGEPLIGLDTPTLLGVWQTAPYLHDGRAATLRDVLTTHNREDRHGRTSQLDDQELDDLVAYLESLDSSDARASLRKRRSSGCSAGREGDATELALFLLLVPRRRRASKPSTPIRV